MDLSAVLVIVFVALFFGWMWLNHRASKKMLGASAKPLFAVFPELNGKQRALVFCYRPNCPPCKAMHPAVRQLAEQTGQVFELDVSQHMGFARTLGIRATPTVLVIQDGHIENIIIGNKNLSFLQKLLESPAT